MSNFLNCYNRQGGENDAKLGQTRAVQAVFATFGSDFHRLLVFSSVFPTNLTFAATFYHFVPHLSPKSFIVKQKLDGRAPTPAVISENTKACG
jgi:hypothetical protein